jgi:hypothetical protein
MTPYTLPQPLRAGAIHPSLHHCNAISRQKSSWLSRGVRFVIAGHSPEPVLETGLLMNAPETKRCDESKAAPNVISLVRFVEQMSRKAGLLRLFLGQCTEISLQLRLAGGGK